MKTLAFLPASRVSYFFRGSCPLLWRTPSALFAFALQGQDVSGHLRRGQRVRGQDRGLEREPRVRNSAQNQEQVKGYKLLTLDEGTYRAAFPRLGIAAV
jgi:hypothetical protein